MFPSRQVTIRNGSGGSRAAVSTHLPTKNITRSRQSLTFSPAQFLSSGFPEGDMSALLWDILMERQRLLTLTGQ